MNHLPLMLTGEPWVRWPPELRSRPMKVSPGCSSARNTAWFIWLPEFGWTLAKLAAEQLLGPLDRQRLGDVDELAAAVVALARIALGVLVGHDRALRLEHGARDDVLRGDQLDLVLLPAELVGGWRRRSRDRSRRASRRRNSERAEVDAALMGDPRGELKESAGGKQACLAHQRLRFQGIVIHCG